MILGVNLHSKLVLLFIILAVAVGLIILFNVDVGLQETLSISESSRSIARFDSSQGFWPALAGITDSVGLRKTLLSLPTAIIYSVGGTSDLTTQLIPIMATLANVLLVSTLASILYGKKAGWLSGFLFMTLPATLFTATAFPFTQPAVSFGLGLLLIYSLNGRSEVKWKWLRVLIMLLLVIVLVVLDLLLAVCLLSMIFALQFFEKENKLPAWLLLVTLIVGLVVGTGAAIGSVFVAFYDSLVQLPEMEVLLPIIFIVLILVLWQPSANNHLPLALLGVSFAGLLWRYSAAGGTGLIGDPLFLMLLLALALLMSELFSSKHTEGQNRKASIWMPIAFVAIAWLAVRGQELFIPSFVGFDWVSLQSLIPALSILPGPVFLLFVAYALFLAEKNTKLARTFSVLLPILFAVALIPYTWQRWHANQPSIWAVNLAKDIITESGATLPVYVVDDERVVRQLEYLSNDAPPSPVTLVTLDSLQRELNLGGGYILYWEDAIQNPPSIWWQMGNFGALGQPRLVLARALDESEASLILEEASATPPNSKEDFENKVGTAINAGKPCLAVSIWIESQRAGVGTQDYFPLFDFPSESCIDLSESENRLAGQEPMLYPGHNRIQYLGGERDLQEGAVISPKYPFFDDPRIFHLETSLDANSIYAYHVELRGAENLMPLYWRIGDDENYLDYGLYRSWTALTVLFSTYGWDEKPLSVTLLPYMYYVTYYGGTAELRDLRLFEVKLDSQTE